MGERLTSKIGQDVSNHVKGSATWALLEEGRGLTLAESTELSATLAAAGFIAGLKTLALSPERSRRRSRHPASPARASPAPTAT
jgi:hypothetical protein